jgi:RNA polymerase sigma-70 factor (ECF subfamily)
VDAVQHAVFSEEVLRQVDRLYRFARFLTRDPAWAEDLVQQTILTAYEKADQLRAGASCRAWLFAILRNFHRMALRQQRRLQVEPGSTGALASAAEAELYPPPLTPEALLQRELTVEAIEEAIAELPALYRDVLVLVDVEGLTYDEAAGVVECGLGTVKSRLYRARNRLRARLAAGGVVEPLLRRAR